MKPTTARIIAENSALKAMGSDNVEALDNELRRIYSNIEDKSKQGFFNSQWFFSKDLDYYVRSHLYYLLVSEGYKVTTIDQRLGMNITW